MKLRKAQPSEVDALNQFIRESKAVWGYSKKFLDEYIKQSGLTKESVENHSVKILENDGEIHGMFRLVTTKKKKIELDLFFVHHKLIKQGIGRKMWGIVDESARANKWKGFILIVDPNTEKFFQRMGAKTVRLEKDCVVMEYALTPTLKQDIL